MIVDDHPVVRKGIAFSLSQVEGISVVAEAESGEDALRLCAEAEPDVVLMDLLMPGMGGVAAIRAIRQTWPNVHLIALSSAAEGNMVREALVAGAISYLLKDISVEDLAQAIQLAHAGTPSLAPGAAQSLIHAVAAVPLTVGHDLTPREREVLTLVAEGCSNRQIAERLVITQATVKFHTRSIRSKLGTSTRTKTAVVALQQHLVNRNMN